MSENICMIEKHLHWVSKRTLAGFGQTHLTNSLYLYYFMCTYIFWVFPKIVGKSIYGDVFMNTCVCVCERVCVCNYMCPSVSQSVSQCVVWTASQLLSVSQSGWSASQVLVGYKDLWTDLSVCQWRSQSVTDQLHMSVSSLDFIGLLGVPWVLSVSSVFERIQKSGPCLHNEVSALTSRGFSSLCLIQSPVELVLS